jgi:hypothetical protein
LRVGSSSHVHRICTWAPLFSRVVARACHSSARIEMHEIGLVSPIVERRQMSRPVPGIYILVPLAAAVILALVQMARLIPGIYIAILVAVAVVLAAVQEFVAYVLDLMRTPAASVDERSYPKLDRRVLVRLAAAGGAAAFLALAGMTAVHLAYPDLFKSVVMWPLNHPSSLLLAGGALYLAVFLCGVKPRQPVLLVCLALPGLVIMPLLLLMDFATSSDVMEALAGTFLVFFIQPAVWILLFIGVGQVRRLRKRGGEFTPAGLARVFLISFAYFFGTIS